MDGSAEFHRRKDVDHLVGALTNRHVEPALAPRAELLAPGRPFLEKVLPLGVSGPHLILSVQAFPVVAVKTHLSLIGGPHVRAAGQGAEFAPRFA